MCFPPIRPQVPGLTSFCVLMVTATAAAAAITVSNTAGSGPGSFHAAVTQAAAVPVGSSAVIDFDPEFFATPRTIILAERLPLVRRTLVIDGPAVQASGEPMVTISGDSNASGVLDNGDVAGLVLEVPAQGAATLRRLRFAGFRTTADPGGAVYFRPGGPASLLIEQCVFSGNFARWGGAVSMGGVGHTATLRDCVFSTNQAFEQDGGAVHLGGTPALVERCVFRANRAPAGGAVHSFHGAAELRDCLFEANETTPTGTGGPGGAVSARLGLRVTNCTFTGNYARAGGALFLNQMQSPAPGAVIVNSTFSANVAGSGAGGAIYAVGTDALLRHCTFTLNHANRQSANDRFVGGGAIAVPEAANVNRISLHNCVLAANLIGGPGPPSTTDLQGPAASFVSLGGNVVGAAEDWMTVFTQPGDRTGTTAQPLSALLDPIGGNGGLLPTHLPLAGSPVIDTGVPGPVPVIDVDQRGLPRPAGSAPDAGAVER